MQHIFWPNFNHLDVVTLLRTGHASFPLVHHPNKFPYAKKLFIVHNNVACNLNVCYVDASYISTPSFHNSCNHPPIAADTHKFRFQMP
jgi:hypothetical protein